MIDPMRELGKLLLFFGLVLVGLGLQLTFGTKRLASWMGHLPGDIIIQRENFTLYFPLATSLLVSVVVTLILWITSFFRHK